MMDLKGDQPEKVSAQAAPEDDTLDLIRLMMEADERQADVHPPRSKPQPDAAPQPKRNSFARLRARPEAVNTQQDTPPFDTPGSSTREDFDELPPSETTPRVSPEKRREIVQALKLAAFVGLAIVLLYHPWVFLIFFFGLIWLTMLIFLLLGGARISKFALLLWSRFEARQPERAATWLAKVQRLADRVDGILARLPDSWTDGVYTPDLNRSEATSRLAREGGGPEDPFEKLAQARRSARPERCHSA